ncbi:ABC transporter permease [Alkalispirochaeta sphaeroplastigenens]|uniref:ABC transporter permease n=1 Tax=Alkalispirochaeta sphaeroplastigenens TaxID=1187066 RepID=A0A2S4JJH2_9SPIO|nr:sugar ABC transporter permease [Alkalispirochaeta sphaeroplastigenens]POQ99683.1 ABC transporter permease [Alkalispirochaeta sphaeroplastigenens]
MNRKYPKKARTLQQSQDLWGRLFVLPAVLFFSIFNFYPILNALWTSLFNRRILSFAKPDFIGLQNYIFLLQSGNFWNSVRATLVFTAGTFLSLLVLSLLVAGLLSRISRGSRFLQTAYYTPAVLSSVVAATIWLLIFDPRGIANQFINTLMNTPGVDHRWFSNPVRVQIATMMVYFWKYIGYFVIVVLAGMASIPKTIYEAATIDGANGWQQYWRITFPLLKPTVVLVSIMSMLQCLKTFSTQYLFTQSGAPLAPINVITLNIYNTGIRDHRIGRASAMSIILLIIMMVFTYIQFKTSKTDEVSY